MKILVLGGSGYIGKQLLKTLASTASPGTATGTSRDPAKLSLPGVSWIKLDTCDVAQLSAVLYDFDGVVNCVAGDAQSISEGTKALTQAALHAGRPRIIHMSTMSVYGPVEGVVHEDKPLNPALGWYGRAKCEAEQHINEYVRQGGSAVVLRPGCVYGPGSELWVGRIARWLQAGRLGDLGTRGDGWSNLVHVNDVCQAVIAALQLPIETRQTPIFNLAAPDSPRWNTYFTDLAMALQLTPVRRIGQRQLQLDALLAGPLLKLAQTASKSLRRSFTLPDYISPGLLSLWSQQIHLDATQAGQRLEMVWTPYDKGLHSSAAWVSGDHHFGVSPKNGMA